MLNDAMQQLISKVFTELPCLACTDYRSDFFKARLGNVFLQLERGEKISVSRDELTRSCCKRAAERHFLTYLRPA